MKPMEPVLKKIPDDWSEVTYAKDQPQYLPLPTLRNADGQVTARWHMTWAEWLRVLLMGDVFVQIHTFNALLASSRVFVYPEQI